MERPLFGISARHTALGRPSGIGPRPTALDTRHSALACLALAQAVSVKARHFHLDRVLSESGEVCKNLRM